MDWGLDFAPIAGKNIWEGHPAMYAMEGQRQGSAGELPLAVPHQLPTGRRTLCKDEFLEKQNESVANTRASHLDTLDSPIRTWTLPSLQHLRGCEKVQCIPERERSLSTCVAGKF